jgi:hypothetical protein
MFLVLVVQIHGNVLSSVQLKDAVRPCRFLQETDCVAGRSIALTKPPMVKSSLR